MLTVNPVALPLANLFRQLRLQWVVPCQAGGYKFTGRRNRCFGRIWRNGYCQSVFFNLEGQDFALVYIATDISEERRIQLGRARAGTRRDVEMSARFVSFLSGLHRLR